WQSARAPGRLTIGRRLPTGPTTQSALSLDSQLGLQLPVGGLFVIRLHARTRLRPGISLARALLFERASQQRGGFGIAAITRDRGAQALHRGGVLSGPP